MLRRVSEQNKSKSESGSGVKLDETSRAGSILENVAEDLLGEKYSTESPGIETRTLKLLPPNCAISVKKKRFGKVDLHEETCALPLRPSFCRNSNSSLMKPLLFVSIAGELQIRQLAAGSATITLVFEIKYSESYFFSDRGR